MNIMFFLTHVDCVFEEDTLGQALSRMEGHQFTSIPIINGHTGAYIGTISEGDILREIKKKDSLSMRFEEDKPVMSLKRKCNYRAVRADADIEDLFDCATSQNFVPVVDDTGVLIGIITRKSILNFLIRSYNKCCDPEGVFYITNPPDTHSPCAPGGFFCTEACTGNPAASVSAPSEVYYTVV